MRFEPFTLADIQRIRPMLAQAPARSCDYTLGGIYMWIDYFLYERAIVGDTLFIRGMSEDDVNVPAFSLPVGSMPLAEAVELLAEHCRLTGETLRFSAVPTETLDELTALGGTPCGRLDAWADYLYDAQALATLSGKKYNKKRNHVNRFVAENPGFTLSPLTVADRDALLDFLRRHPLSADKGIMAEYERMQSIKVIKSIDSYPFVGGILRTPSHGIVAFTIGEIIGDTLHLHIEKADHTVNGASEAVNQLFAAKMLSLHPQIRIINRQDDAGDEGLRKAKLSYHPLALVEKHNVLFPT